MYALLSLLANIVIGKLPSDDLGQLPSDDLGLACCQGTAATDVHLDVHVSCVSLGL